MPTSTGAPQTKQKSRKGKSAWRKNIDVGDVDAALDEARARERTGTGAVSKAISGVGSSTSRKQKAKASGNAAAAAAAAAEEGTSLFVEDRAGDVDVGARMARVRKAQRPLRSLEVLAATNAVPALSGRARSSAHATISRHKTNAASVARAAAAVSKKTKEQLRRAAGRPVRGPFGAIVESEQAKPKDASVADAEYDMWLAQKQTLIEQGKQGSDEWIEHAKKREVKVGAGHILTLNGSNA